MHPYENLGFFSFAARLMERLFLIVTFQLTPGDWVPEDIQFLALVLSGMIGLFLGFQLIYNKMTMVANSLSHTVLLGIVVAFIIFKSFYKVLSPDAIPFWVLISASVLSSLLTVALIRYLSKRVSQEASNAFSFTAFFALGILLSSVLIKNVHLGLESVLGDLEIIQVSDVNRLFWTLVAVVGFCTLLKSRLQLICFDPFYAKTIGCSVERIRGGLIFLAAICLGVCFRALGVILVLSLLTAPILIGRLFFHNARKILLFGMGWVVFQALLSMTIVQGLYIEYDLPISTSGLYGFLGLLFYLIAVALEKIFVSIQFLQKTS